MSSLEHVDCIFEFFGERPQFAVVEEYTCNIRFEVLILTALLIFLLSNFLFSVLNAYIARLFLRFMSFPVSSRLPNNLHYVTRSALCA